MTMTSRILLPDLPVEVLQQIFQHIYPPWHLEYTQEHDLDPSASPPSTTITNTLIGTPLFARLPSISPLLINKSLSKLAQPIFTTSFSGQVHITSRLRWKTVHASYEGVMRRATSLALDLDQTWSFIRLGFLEKLSRVREVYATIGAERFESFVIEYRMREGEMVVERVVQQEWAGSYCWMEYLDVVVGRLLSRHRDAVEGFREYIAMENLKRTRRGGR